MERDEKLIENILTHIEKSKTYRGKILFNDVTYLFSTDKETFCFHANLLLSANFIKGEFKYDGFIYYGLTMSGFDYCASLKTPVKAFFKQIVRDHTSMVSLFIASISLLWHIIEFIVSILQQ